ncbi:hypothetical protein HZI73_01435 [Vallitalea pronyensis]|uniref:SipW-cognate class signal peptide n=1 Tax=Vallitalea pronyensis TaxID=1348613 RepID=A0A8J8MGF3_9FIRM|nr:hypothetical protein [Vallitalea pronyensis]QUI21037.1 hypothetical protein HZI73_01435 [Vallitalea pronyensis]
MKLYRLNTLIIALSLITVIGIMGVGYAQWTDDLHLFGKVSTGYASISLGDPYTKSIPSAMSITKPGDIKYPFTITNTGTVPMKLASKSDNIDFECDELISGGNATGYIVASIPDGLYGRYIEALNGTVRMVALNDSWFQDIDVTASLHVNIQKPIKKVVVKPMPESKKPTPSHETDLSHDKNLNTDTQKMTSTISE